MANEWLRLWHDMPTDPKFRTVSRVSEQPISLVISVYMHLLVSASRNVTRGHADVTEEDIASALDAKEAEINSIVAAMQGRLLDGFYLTGWEKRQPKKEDAGSPETGAMSAVERKRLQREREKSEQKNNDVTESHGESRIVTTDKDKDKDKDKDITNSSELVSAPPKKQKRVTQKNLNTHTPDDELNFSAWPDRPSEQVWTDYKKMRSTKRAWLTQTTVDHIGKVLDELYREGYLVNQVLALATVRNWTGLEVHWVVNNYASSARAPPQQFLNSRERDAIRGEATFDYNRGTDFGDPHCE